DGGEDGGWRRGPQGPRLGGRPGPPRDRLYHRPVRLSILPAGRGGGGPRSVRPRARGPLRLLVRDARLPGGVDQDRTAGRALGPGVGRGSRLLLAGPAGRIPRPDDPERGRPPPGRDRAK